MIFLILCVSVHWQIKLFLYTFKFEFDMQKQAIAAGVRAVVPNLI